jgi:hypothetical protein
VDGEHGRADDQGVIPLSALRHLLIDREARAGRDEQRGAYLVVAGDAAVAALGDELGEVADALDRGEGRHGAPGELGREALAGLLRGALFVDGAAGLPGELDERAHAEVVEQVGGDTHGLGGVVGPRGAEVHAVARRRRGLRQLELDGLNARERGRDEQDEEGVHPIDLRRAKPSAYAQPVWSCIHVTGDAIAR